MNIQILTNYNYEETKTDSKIRNVNSIWDYMKKNGVIYLENGTMGNRTHPLFPSSNRQIISHNTFLLVAVA